MKVVIEGKYRGERVAGFPVRGIHWLEPDRPYYQLIPIPKQVCKGFGWGDRIRATFEKVEGDDGNEE